ncbi:MAG: hypothetical protein KGL54_11665 [Sphingomonadales bacterium]|nr:hypothetical protein [Sphingomonadales bacterium]
MIGLWRIGLAMLLLAIGGRGAAAAPAPVPGVPGGALGAEAVARCIARHAPRGGQFYQAGDGTFRVVSYGPRGKAAEWTVRAGAEHPGVTRVGGTAGLDRVLRGTCY